MFITADLESEGVNKVCLGRRGHSEDNPLEGESGS